MRSEKFCCCLPVRMGVFVLSLVQTISSAFLSGIIFYSLSRKDIHYETSQRITMVVAGGITGILALVSFCGLLGSLLARRTLVRIYKLTLQILLVLSVLSGILFIIFLFRTSSDEVIRLCKESAEADGAKDTSYCNNITAYRIATCIVFAITWFIHAYECIIVARYLHQLQWEKEQRWHMSSLRSFTGQQQPFMPYYPVSGHDEEHGRPTSQYTFKR